MKFQTKLKISQSKYQSTPVGRGSRKGLLAVVKGTYERIAMDVVFVGQIGEKPFFFKTSSVECYTGMNGIVSDYTLTPYSTYRSKFDDLLAQDLIDVELTEVNDEELLKELEKEARYC